LVLRLGEARLVGRSEAHVLARLRPPPTVCCFGDDGALRAAGLDAGGGGFGTGSAERGTMGQWTRAGLLVAVRARLEV
jgi:hypothetical protein